MRKRIGRKGGMQRPFMAFVYPIIILIYSAMSIYSFSFSFSLSLSSLFCLANFATVCWLCHGLLAYINGKTFSSPSPLLPSSCCSHKHTRTPIFLFSYWYSFFNSHFFVANPRHCVIVLIHSYCTAGRKSYGFVHCWSCSNCHWVHNRFGDGIRNNRNRQKAELLIRSEMLWYHTVNTGWW